MYLAPQVLVLHEFSQSFQVTGFIPRRHAEPVCAILSVAEKRGKESRIVSIDKKVTGRLAAASGTGGRV